MLNLKTTVMLPAVSGRPSRLHPERDDEVYAVTPAAITVRTGIVTAELTEMKVTERVERGTGRIDAPARLTAKLKLQNGSTDQTVRLIGATMVISTRAASR